VLGRSPLHNFAVLEPEGNLLLGILNTVRAMTNIPAHINTVVASDGTWGRCERVGGTEEDTTSLDGIATFPNHSANGSAAHILDESWEEWLGGEILVVLLKMLLAGSHELDSSKLVATSLESGDDWANESTLDAIRLNSNEGLLVRHGVVV